MRKFLLRASNLDTTLTGQRAALTFSAAKTRHFLRRHIEHRDLVSQRNLRQIIQLSCLAAVIGLSAAAPALAAEVNGIYTDSSTKDLGKTTGLPALEGIKFRGWIDGYYVYNLNTVDNAVANANQSASAIKSRDLTTEGRTFDVHSNSFSLSLAEIEVEKVPEVGDLGFKFDMAFGDTQDIIVDTIQSVSPTSVSTFDKTFQHASLSYLAPIGSGLRIDFGKFVTHIGGETIESIKNLNYSHSFFYTYAIPFQDSGFRFNYAWSPTFYNEVYLLNGWNVTSDNNKDKTIGLTAGWTPSADLALYLNYLGGPERNDNNHDRRDLFDMQLVYNLTPKLMTMLNVDLAQDANAAGAGHDAKWGGGTAYLRYSCHDRFFPTLRVEYYDDPQGFSTGVAQHLWGYTVTGDYKIAGKHGINLMLRPEIRYDQSDAAFFSKDARFRTKKDQTTLGFGAVVYF